MDLHEICDQVKKHIDPIRGGPIAKWREALYDEICKDPLEYCQQFKKDKTINPLTNRAIKQDSKVRIFFDELLKAVNMKQSTKRRPSSNQQLEDIEASIHKQSIDIKSIFETLSNHQLILNNQTHNIKIEVKDQNKQIKDELSILTRRLKTDLDQQLNTLVIAQIKLKEDIDQQLKNMSATQKKLQDDHTHETNKHNESIEKQTKQLYNYIHKYADYNNKAYQKQKNFFGKAVDEDSPRTAHAKEEIRKEHYQQEERKKANEEARRQHDEDLKRQEEQQRKRQEEARQKASDEQQRKRQEEQPKSLSKQKTNAIIVKLKAYYIETLKAKIATGQPINKRFVLLNYHPDKLPVELKGFVSTSKEANVYASRVFSGLNKADTITMALLQRILVTELAGGKINIKQKNM